MTITRITSHRVLTFTLGLVIALGIGIWTQVPASAQEPEAGEPSLSIQLVPEADDLGITGLANVPVFNVGDTFQVSVVALGAEDPGIFGSQFEVQYDTTYLRAVEGSLTAGSAIQPVVNPINDIDLDNGLIRFAASRQGDLENLTGNVVLATLSFETIAATEPPEGQTTIIDLLNVKLGAKGGIPVSFSGIVDLELIIRDDTTPGRGDIIGNVTVEGRAADNQAGHLVTAAVTDTVVATGTTEANGDFWINNAPADIYALTAERAGFLDAACTDVEHTLDLLTELHDAILLAGDIDDSHKIDITDAVAIGNAFGSVNPDETANLNADEQVDVLDLILMAANYNQTSEDNPWVCNPA